MYLVGFPVSAAADPLRTLGQKRGNLRRIKPISHPMVRHLFAGLVELLLA